MDIKQVEQLRERMKSCVAKKEKRVIQTKQNYGPKIKVQISFLGYLINYGEDGNGNGAYIYITILIPVPNLKYQVLPIPIHSQCMDFLSKSGQFQTIPEALS